MDLDSSPFVGGISYCVAITKSSFICLSSLAFRSLTRRRETKNVAKPARSATPATPPTTPPATAPLVEEETGAEVPLGGCEVGSTLLEDGITRVEKFDFVPVAGGGTITPMLVDGINDKL